MRLGALVLATMLGATAPAQDATCTVADYVLKAQRIYTANDAYWTAERVAVRGDRIVFVGSAADARATLCAGVEEIDLGSAVIYPGFTDSHQHLEGVGRRTKTLSLFSIPTLEETVGAIRAWAQTVPEESWVLGRGWIEREWTDEQRFLTRDDVDPFTPTKPLFMPRADGVSALVNSRALELAGITKDTPDPEGGRFERDAEGEPTGYVLARAMDPFRAIIPEDSDDYLRDNLIKGMKANASLGWTQTQDAGMAYRLVDLMKA
ncbi:MAG: amidohydrolase family protein, partial [Pseudomonadota bacterium]|nr:amidohydrolase family protein [Pseudomonadota bacterium]